jgi:hypothetical protein
LIPLPNRLTSKEKPMNPKNHHCFHPGLMQLERRDAPGNLFHLGEISPLADLGIVSTRDVGDGIPGLAASSLAAIGTPEAMGPSVGGAVPVVPPWARYEGLTYGQWSARWWQWAFSLPAENNPLLDTAPAETGQTGRVWFLGGSFVSTNVTRSITMPSGTALFFPVANGEEDTLAVPGASPDQLRADAAAQVDGITNMFATVDGKSVPNLQGYRIQSPLFTITMPQTGTNLYQYFGLNVPNGATGTAVTDGYYLLLPPLHPGHHTLAFGGHSPGDPNAGQAPFDFSVTYNITVTRGH